MTSTRTLPGLLALVAVGAALHGCSDDDPTPFATTDVVLIVDALPSADADVVADAAPDSEPEVDAAADAEPDADADSASDSDTVADAKPDAASDADADAASDADADTGPPSCGDWTTLDDISPGPADEELPWGFAAGAVRTDRATVVVPTFGPTTVRIRYSYGPDCEELTTDWVLSDTATDYVTHIPLTDLVPDKVYRYRVELPDGALSSAGWLVTAPVDDVPFVVAFTADIGANLGYWTLLDEFAASGADIYLSLGDWPYADLGGAAYDLAEYREKHRMLREHDEMKTMLRYLPVNGIWDDHEVTNDWDGADTAANPSRVEAGMQAWREWFPLRDAPPGEIYRRHAWGPNVDIFWLDARSHRDANADPDGPTKTMLGAEQLQWLLDELSLSPAAFKLIMTSVPLDYGTTGNDHWAGFTWERQIILDHIEQQQIGGVIFLTADQHWLAVHHLQNGLKEFQVGALAQFPRTPDPAVPPWVLIQEPVLNYGLLAYQPGDPPTLTVSSHGEDGLLYTETVQAGRGAIQINAPSPVAGWTLTGAHTFYGQGTATLPWATPGTYTITWTPALPGDPVPAPETKTLVDGATLVFGDAEPLEALLLEPFDGPGLDGWTVVDQGVTDPSSDWNQSQGAAVETGNCYDENLGESVVPKLGTFLWRQDVSLGDGLLLARVYMGDDDGVGLMYGVQGEETYYRIGLDNQRSFARLVRADAGSFTVLAEDLSYAPPLGAWFTLAVERIGGVHRVYVDGVEILVASDTALGAGSVALYCYGMDDGRFDDVAVYPNP